MLKITEINGQIVGCKNQFAVVELPSDFILEVTEIGDKEGTTIDMLDENGNIASEFYFEFFIQGEKGVYRCSAELNKNGMGLTNVVVQEGKVYFVFDHDLYHFATTGKLRYRQMGRTVSTIMEDGVFECWDSGELPILLKKVTK